MKEPLIPTDGEPPFTAFIAYSICISLPEGLKKQKFDLKGS